MIRRSLVNIEYTTLTTIILCAFIVRIWGSWEYYYHTDELIHNFIANAPSLKEVFYRGLNETHPPLGHFIRHLYFKINDSIIFNRFITICFGVASVFFCFLIGRKITSNRYGILLALLCAFSSITVTYSVSARGYAFFLFFLTATYYFFLEYIETRTLKSFILYLLFSLCAAATHFSGFIFAFIIFLSIFIQLLLEKKKKDVYWLILTHFLHILLLGILFYFYFVFTPIGQGWYDFYLNLKPFKVLRTSDNAILTNIISVYFGFFFWNFSFFVVALIFTICGTYYLWRGNRIVAITITIAIASQLLLAALQIYPLTGSRYGIYLYLFIILPIGKSLFKFMDNFHIKTHYLAILCLIIFGSVGFTIYAANNRLYTTNNGEFTSTIRSFGNGVNYLKDHTTKNDIILTNKGSWLHLLYISDKYNSGYFPESLGHMRIFDAELYFQEKRNFWEYILQNNFYDFLYELKKHINPQSVNNVWFAMFGTSDFSIMTISECSALKPFLKNRFSDKEVLIFEIDKNYFLQNFFPPKESVNSCFTNSTVPVMGSNF